MKVYAKIRSVSSNRDMLRAYGRWMRAKAVSRTPRLALPQGATIGEWLSFSEYWSFHGIISNAELQFVERSLEAQQNGTTFDIGANVGAFTCLIASLSHTVHAFEPVPETFCRLKSNVKFNGLLNYVRLNCVAVGEREGAIKFRIDDRSAPTNRMAIETDSINNKNTSLQLLSTINLDTYCEHQEISTIDLVKLDVEGMEPYVLRGARRLLRDRSIATILMEVCPKNLDAVGLSPADLYNEFRSTGYSAYALNADGTTGERLSLTQIDSLALCNVVLSPDA